MCICMDSSCTLPASAVSHVMAHLGETAQDVRQAAAAATAAALEVRFDPIDFAARSEVSSPALTSSCVLLRP